MRIMTEVKKKKKVKERGKEPSIIIFLDILKDQRFHKSLQKPFRESFFKKSWDKSFLSSSFLSLHVNTCRILTYAITVLLL